MLEVYYGADVVNNLQFPCVIRQRMVSSSNALRYCVMTGKLSFAELHDVSLHLIRTKVLALLLGIA